MSRLLLIRHGRTEGPLHDRDRIGETGRAEAARTATALLDDGVTFTHAFSGPANRHLQTFDAMAAVFTDRRHTFPARTVVETLDEYDAPAIFEHLLPRWLASQGREMPPPGTPVPLDRKAYEVLEGVGTAWATGALQDLDVEPWTAFQDRCVRGLQQLTAIPDRGATVLCTTSAGVIAAIVGHLLELPPARAFGLSLVVRNASVTELLFSGGRSTLFSFNVLPTGSRPPAP